MKYFPLALAAAACVHISMGCTGVSHSSAENDDTVRVLPDTMRVATLYSPSSYFIFRDQKMGYDYELVRDMVESHGMALDLRIARTLDEAVEWLDSGYIHLIAYEVPVTAQYADHTIPCGIESVTHQVLVQPKNSKDLITDVTQLVGRDVYVARNSKYHQRIDNLDRELGGGINIHALDMDSIITEDVIEMVSEGKIPLTIVDSDIARVNRTYFTSIDVNLVVSLDQKSAWAVSASNQWLADSINAWTGEPTPKLEQRRLLRRYFELSKNEPSVYTLDLSKGVMSPFDNIFKQHTSKSWDWRLLAAQAFIESRFDASQVSWAGARGIMQVMPATARAYGVSAEQLVDNETSITVAQKILSNLDKALANKVPDATERQRFVLAAYNSGIAHVYDAIALAQHVGLDPTKWYGNVESALLLKSNPDYYNLPICKYGYFRGRQTTAYVRHVSEVYESALKSIKP